MIITKEHEVTVESTFTGDTVTMGLDPEGLAHIMEVLSGLYGDPAMAVVREYSTNAIDSQVENGVKRPIEITSPSWTDSNFSVRDYGCGMDVNDIRNIYALYGASTKRNSNDFNGSLGLGSKSAFSYSNQFTVESIKDGIKTIVVVSKDEEGMGQMTIVAETATDDASGTKITVPVSSVPIFIGAINTFAKRLSPGLALVDGKELSEWGTYKKVLGTIRDSNGNIVINGIYHTEQYYYGDNDRVYMGGVSYPAPKAISDVRTSPSHNIMIDVPLGAVKFSPSRESLKDVKSTREVLELAGTMYKKHYASTVKDNISKAKDIFEALSIFTSNTNFLTSNERSSLTYSGVVLGQINNRCTFPGEIYSWTSFNNDNTPTKGRTAYRQSYIYISEVSHAVFVRGYSYAKGVSTPHKDRVQYWAENHFTAPKHWDTKVPLQVYCTDTVPANFATHPVLKNIEWVDWEDIKAVKMPSKPRAQGARRPALEGKRDVMTKDGAYFDMQDVDSLKAKKIYYFVGTQMRESVAATIPYATDADLTMNVAISTWLEEQSDDTIVVKLYANSVSKFEKQHPKAIKLPSYEKMQDIEQEKVYNEFVKNVQSEAFSAYSLNSSPLIRILSQASKCSQKIDDPEIKSLAEDYLNRSGGSYGMLKGKWRVKADKVMAAEVKAIQDRLAKIGACYPMLSVVYLPGTGQGALIVANYINDIYNRNKESE